MEDGFTAVGVMLRVAGEGLILCYGVVTIG